MRIHLSSVVAFLFPLHACTLELSFQNSLDNLKNNLVSLREGANLDSLYHGVDALRQRLEMPAFIKQYKIGRASCRERV